MIAIIQIISYSNEHFRTTGTDLDKILPPVSRFGGGREKKKATVIGKLSAFFERFFGDFVRVVMIGNL